MKYSNKWTEFSLNSLYRSSLGFWPFLKCWVFSCSLLYASLISRTCACVTCQVVFSWPLSLSCYLQMNPLPSSHFRYLIGHQNQRKTIHKMHRYRIFSAVVYLAFLPPEAFVGEKNGHAKYKDFNDSHLFYFHWIRKMTEMTK